MKERIVILGAGESGVGAAMLARHKGYEVFLSDNGTISPQHLRTLETNNIEFEQRRHSIDKILSATEVIKSPGIPDDVDVVRQLRDKGIPVIGEIEFAIRFTHAKMLAITGTNGKTTTSLLLYHLLKEAGLTVGLAGNVGQSLAKQVIENNKDIYVVELSSFQLDNLLDFQSEMAIILNITPDHLNRYDNDISKYVDAKFRILNNMRPDQYFIYFYDDPLIRNRISTVPIDIKKVPVSIRENLIGGAFIRNNNLEFNEIGSEKSSFQVARDNVPLNGDHNMINAMAAVTAASLLGVSSEAIKLALASFKNQAHRLETVGTVQDVTFVNDSKATNVDAVYYALGAFNSPIIWIAGGVDKGNDYHQIKELVKSNVKSLICLGIDNQKLTRAFREVVPVIMTCDNMDDAVRSSFELAKKGDIILLSPACASFDLFNNYEDRGNQFKAAVKSLIDKEKGVHHDG